MKHTAQKGRHQPANAPAGPGTTPSKVKQPPRPTSPKSARPSKMESASVFVTTPFEPALSLVDVADFPDLEEMMEQISDKDCIRKLLARLTPQEERVIRLRYGRGAYPPEPCRDIGEDFGLSRTRISQIEQKALRRMRHFAMKSSLRFPNTGIDRLRGNAKASQDVVPARQAQLRLPDFSEPEEETQAVRPLSPPSRIRPPCSSKPEWHPEPCRKPQHQRAPSHLRSWPLRIAMLAACCAPFAILDLILVSETARTLLAAVVGKWVTAALVMLACYLVIVPVAFLEDCVDRGRCA